MLRLVALQRVLEQCCVKRSSRREGVLGKQIQRPPWCMITTGKQTHSLTLCCMVQMRVQVYVSFGGLLMQLTGDLQKLQDLDVDANIYLLMRKV